MIEIGLEGVGPAYAFRDGQVYQLNWNRAGTEAVLTLTYTDGTPFPFKPGATWFEIVGKSSQITNQGGIWRFWHQIPLIFHGSSREKARRAAQADPFAADLPSGAGPG